MTSTPADIRLSVYVDGFPVDVTDRIDNLRFGTKCPGGDAEASWTELWGRDLNPGELYTAAATVTIADNEGVFWLGRIARFRGDYWHGGAAMQWTATGMERMLSDLKYTHQQKWVSGKRIDEIIKEAVEELCPTMIAVPEVDIRVIREHTQDFVLASAQTVIDTMAPLGDAVAPLIYEVYSGGSDIPILTTRARPTAPAYFCRITDGPISAVPVRGGAEVDVGMDLESIYNEVVIKYRDERVVGGYAVAVFDAGSELLGGTIRADTIDINRMAIRNVKVLNQTAQARLAVTSNPQNTGVSVALHYAQDVLDTDLEVIPALWRMRAGHIIKVQDLFSGEVNLGNEFFPLTTQFDMKSLTQTLSCGPVRI